MQFEYKPTQLIFDLLLVYFVLVLLRAFNGYTYGTLDKLFDWFKIKKKNATISKSKLNVNYASLN